MTDKNVSDNSQSVADKALISKESFNYLQSGKNELSNREREASEKREHELSQIKKELCKINENSKSLNLKLITIETSFEGP